MQDKVKVEVSLQGEAVVSKQGYMKKGSKEDGLVAFYLDAWGKTGRAYPSSTCDNPMYLRIDKKYPSIQLLETEEDKIETEIYFPEYEGWSVFSVTGGKTLSICLFRKGVNK